MLTLQLPFQQQPSAQVWVAGQINAEHLAQLKAAGVQHIINLRPASEDPSFDEAPAATALGLHYHALPIAGVADLSLANAQALDALLAKIGDAPVLLHCASGNRVGALMAMRAAWLHGAAVEEALALGRAYGLTRMQDTVQQLLS